MTFHSFAIRREDKSIWEKRTPIIPSHARELIQKHGIQIFVQPSRIRIFSDEEYRSSGAIVKEELDAPLIIGVKEFPKEILESNKTYLFFSHTIKSQSYNMPLLKKLIDLNCTLIDYERIVDARERRLIAFGKHAGIAGMIDTLWALGRRLRDEGIESPFSEMKRAYDYKTVKEFREHAREIGASIARNGLPSEISPVVIGFAGYGNVSQGAQEILDMLPVEEISPCDLTKLSRNAKCIYKAIFKESDMVKRKDGGEFKLEDYYTSPANYQSIFESYLSQLTVLVNAIYWDNRYPRLLTKEWLKKNHSRSHKLKLIGDISCDIHGAIECTEKITDPADPVFVFNPAQESVTMGTRGDGLLILAVDILPSEIPVESSLYFSEKLKPLIVEILGASFPENFSQCTLPEHLKKAVIVYRGKLTKSYEYLKENLRST